MDKTGLSVERIRKYEAQAPGSAESDVLRASSRLRRTAANYVMHLACDKGLARRLSRERSKHDSELGSTRSNYGR